LGLCRVREEPQDDQREDTPEPSLKGVKQSRRIASRKNEKKEVPVLKMPKLQVQLTRQEIMDDFIAITGRRPQGKPKKSLILSYVSVSNPFLSCNVAWGG
jgi:hypothetical protein